ncbi:MAG TPA: DinB family protein [Actinomycetes bacterium]
MSAPPRPLPPHGELAARVEAAARRVRGNLSAWPTGALTEPEPGTGERWDAGQVLAHVAEMLPYWVGEAEKVAAGPDGVAFGRVKTDPGRVAAIERDRRDDPLRLLARIDQGVAGVLALLGRLDGAALGRAGSHQKLGRMTVAEIVEEFLVGHLEEHADQLAGLSPGKPAP